MGSMSEANCIAFVPQSCKSCHFRGSQELVEQSMIVPFDPNIYKVVLLLIL